MYADVLFLLNFMMDALVLLFTSFLCRMRCGDKRLRARQWRRMCLAAAVGAAGSCLIEIARLVWGIQWLSGGVGALFAGIVLCAMMTGIAFRPRTAASACRQVLAVYAGAFLIGGVCGWLQVHMRAVPYGLLLLVSVGLCAGCREVFWRIQSVQARLVQVRIFCGEKTVCVKGLVDTGNTLTLTGTRTPVSVIDGSCILPAFTQTQTARYKSICAALRLKACAEAEYRSPFFEKTAAAAALRESERESPDGERVSLSYEEDWQPVIYHSVGCAHGMLPAFCAAHVYIKAEDRELHQERMWIALSPTPLSKRYSMLLHPAHIPLEH